MPVAIDLTGQRFHRLTVLTQAPMIRGRYRAWHCRCVCGTEIVITTQGLRSGDTKSCGCLKRHVTSKIMTTHGHTRNGNSRTYDSWRAMRGRCLYRTNDFYHLYGGRGIKVCERWHSFENFLADMGPRPDGTTLDRYPNTEGNYEPGNFRWATSNEQSQYSTKAKLSADQVREILGRVEHGERQVSVARRLGVSKGIVSAIITRRTWTNISAEASS
jgi:hypothetical protein